MSPENLENTSNFGGWQLSMRALKGRAHYKVAYLLRNEIIRVLFSHVRVAYAFLQHYNSIFALSSELEILLSNNKHTLLNFHVILF